MTFQGIASFRLVFFASLFWMKGHSFAQDDWYKHNLRGKVYKIHERNYHAKIRDVDSVYKTDLIASCEYEFDRAGNLIRWSDFYQDNMIAWFYVIEFDTVHHQKIQWYKQNERYVSASTVFQYDENGKELYWYHRDGSEIPVYCWKNTYDKRGFKKASYSYNGVCRDTMPDSYYQYKNDREGRRLKEKWYDVNGECFKQIRTQYLEKTYTVVTSYYSGKGEFSEKWIYSYTEYGLLIQSAHYWANEQLASITSYEYDDWGVVTEIKEYDAVEDKTNTKRYKYIFDEHHNWIGCVEYVNDVAQKIIEREITYFE